MKTGRSLNGGVFKLDGVWPVQRLKNSIKLELWWQPIFPSLIAQLLWMLAVQAIGPNLTSIFINLMPVFTAIIASLWLSEQWTIYHSIGGVMILVGIVMAQKKTVKAPATRVESA